MASTCAIYKGSRKIGTGSVADGTTAVSSFVLTDSVYGTRVHNTFGRNVKVTITESGSHLGRSFDTRIISDDGAGNLVIRDATPFVGA